MWVNNKLKSDILEKLNNIAKEFLTYIDIPLDVVDIEIVGSNASYNYTDTSDLDLHIIVNNEVNYVDIDILRKLFNAKKNSFNDNYNLKIEDIDVELYIEDLSSGNATNGRYSIIKDNWVLKPKKQTNINIPNIDDKLKNIKDKVNTTISGNDDKAILEMINEIYMMRKISLAQDGEFGEGNLIFKALRDENTIEKLKDKYYEIRSAKLSESVKTEASLSRLHQHTKDKDTFAVIGSQDQDTKKSRFNELKYLVGKLRNKISNIGFNYLEGTYTYDDGEQGIEDSLIVYNIPKDDALDIANKLNQESIIWKDNNYFGFIDQSGNELDEFNNNDKNLTFDDKITNLYGSRLRSGNKYKPAFAFECKLIETTNTGDNFSKQHQSAIIKYPVCNINLKDKEN